MKEGVSERDEKEMMRTKGEGRKYTQKSAVGGRGEHSKRLDKSKREKKISYW